jgi:hypothetical protein
MPFPFALFRGLLLRTLIMFSSCRARRFILSFFQVAIGICNITSIVISMLAFVAKTGGRKHLQALSGMRTHQFVFSFRGPRSCVKRPCSVNSPSYVSASCCIVECKADRPVRVLVMYCRRDEEASNTLNLVTFGALWLVNTGTYFQCGARPFHSKTFQQHVALA